MLAREAERDRLVINPLVYAEVSLAFDRIEELDAAIPADFVTREPLLWDPADRALTTLDPHYRLAST
jgi:hypothetical protein